MNEKNTGAELFGLAARLALAGIFVYSGAVKALAPAEEFAYAIEGYKVLNSQLSLYAAYAVPWIELWSGLLLAAGVFARLNALFLGGLLVFFELLLGQAWLRKLPVTSCGCFGSSHSNSLEREFAQNLVFLALAWAAWKYGGRWSADELADRP